MENSSSEIINKVELSGLITIDLADFLPTEEMVFIDLLDFLYEGQILREKDFREKVTATNWSVYQNKIVGIYCSVDVLIQNWAYMILAANLHGNCSAFYIAEPTELLSQVMNENLSKNLHPEQYEAKRIVIKGCGDIKIPESAYLTASKMLLPFVKSLMFGEPCSTVPVYKKAKR